MTGDGGLRLADGAGVRRLLSSMAARLAASDPPVEVLLGVRILRRPD